MHPPLYVHMRHSLDEEIEAPPSDLEAMVEDGEGDLGDGGATKICGTSSAATADSGVTGMDQSRASRGRMYLERYSETSVRR